MENYFWVYILHCENNRYYTGYTVDIAKRYLAHQNGTSRCKFTKSFKPLALAQSWQVNGDKALAMRIERYVKNLSRTEKIKLILNPDGLTKIFPSCNPFSCD